MAERDRDPQVTTPETRDFDPTRDRKVSTKVHQRLQIAQEVLGDVKAINAHAGNQREGIQATNGNSAYRGSILRDDIDDQTHWKFNNHAGKLLAEKYPEAFHAAKAEILHLTPPQTVANAGGGGTCWDQAVIAYYFLRIKAAGNPIAVVSSPIDHAFTHIGDHEKEDHGEVAVCDAWPTKATACPWDEHFCHGDISKGLNMIADGGGKADDGKTDAKEAIKASLALTDYAKRFVQTTMTDEQTERHLASGRRTDENGKLKYAERELSDQPVYMHWSNVTTTRRGAEIRSLDPESAGGRYMTEEQINNAAGEPTSERDRE
jgi:hypothetical protein